MSKVEYLTVKETAALFRTTRDNIRAKINSGEIRAIQFGGTERIQWRIPRSALDEYEEANSNQKVSKSDRKKAKPKPARSIV